MLSSNQQLQDSLRTTQSELEKTAQSKRLLADAATQVASKVTFATRAMAASQVVLNALGGWIGVVTLALSVGISMWAQWGDKGAEAIKKIKDAIDSGTATKDTVGLIDQQIAANKTEQQQVQEAINAANERYQRSGRGPTDAQQAQQAARVQLLQQLYDKEQQLNQTRQTAMVQAEKNTGADLARVDNANYDSALRDLHTQNQRVLAEQAELDKQKLDQTTAGSKERAAVEKQIADRARTVAQKDANDAYNFALAQQKRVQGLLDDARQNGSDPFTVAKYQQELDHINAEVVQRQAAKINADALFKPNDLGPPKNTPRDPLNTALQQSLGDLAAARIKLDDLSDGIITYQRLYDAALAKLKADRASGRFKNGASDAELSQIANNKAKTEEIKRQVTALSDLNRMTAGIDQDLATAQQRFAPDAHFEAPATGVRGCRDCEPDPRRNSRAATHFAAD